MQRLILMLLWWLMLRIPLLHVPKALPVLVESGKFAVGGITPNLIEAVEASWRGGRRKGEREQGRT